jgi:hypothetical protein
MSDLINAIYSNDIETIKDLIKNGADVNYYDQDGNTPLYAAYKEKNIEILRYLIENGVDINNPEFIEKGQNILHYLIINGVIKVKLNDYKDVPEEIINGIDMYNNYHKIRNLKDSKEHAEYAIKMEKNIILCYCGKEKKYICSQCQAIGYCSLECQRLDWKKHKPACKKISAFSI